MTTPAIPAAWESLFKTDIPRMVRQLLPDPADQSRFIQNSWRVLQATPKLYKCSTGSFIEAAVRIAQLRLDAGTALGEAWILPYGGVAKAIVGYKGFLTLMRRAGVSVDCQLVYQTERFERHAGSTPHIVHEPADDTDGLELRGGYVMAWLPGLGQPLPFWLSAREIYKRRDHSRSWQMDQQAVQAWENRGSPENEKPHGESPWSVWPDPMMRKTIVRAAASMLPMSWELADAVALDEQSEGRQAPLSQLPGSVEAELKQLRGADQTEALREALLQRAAGNEQPPARPLGRPEEV